MVSSRNLKHNFVPRRGRQSRQQRVARSQTSHDWSLTLETDTAAQRTFPIPLSTANDSDDSAEPCSFYSLPGELRNEIYSLALEGIEFGWEQAGLSRPPPSAVRSLSHVSRLVRAELGAMFYAEHNFQCGQVYYHQPNDLKGWAHIWGVLAAPNIRSLSLWHGNGADDHYIDIRLDNVKKPATTYFAPFPLPKLRSGYPTERDVNHLLLALALVIPSGELVLRAERLMAFFRGLNAPRLRPREAAVAYRFATKSTLRKKQAVSQLLSNYMRN